MYFLQPLRILAFDFLVVPEGFCLAGVVYNNMQLFYETGWSGFE